MRGCSESDFLQFAQNALLYKVKTLDSQLSPRIAMFALLRKLKFLTVALILSSSANVGLICALWKSAYTPPQMRLAELMIDCKEMSQSNCAVLKQISNWNYARLTAELSNQEIVEDGFTRGGLALTTLIANFDFDVQRSLSDRKLQKRRLENQKDGLSYELIAGLDERDFAQIQQFARQERWPITDQGLHKLIKQSPISEKGSKSGEEQQLAEAFVRSNAFAYLERLFPADIPASELLKLASHLDWHQLPQFNDGCDQADRHRAQQRRDLLLKAVEQGSKSAAYLLILCDFDFSLRQIRDTDMAQLLLLLDTYTAEAMNIVVGVLKSPRDNTIRELAAKRVSCFLNVPLPAKKDQLPLFADAILNDVKIPPSVQLIDTSELSSQPHLDKVEAAKVFEMPLNEKLHIVERGDTLWKLSKKYGLSVKQLMRVNELKQDFLKIGQVLQVDLL